MNHTKLEALILKSQKNNHEAKTVDFLQTEETGAQARKGLLKASTSGADRVDRLWTERERVDATAGCSDLMILDIS